MGNVVEIKRTYAAKVHEVPASGMMFKSAGTLDGFVDLSVAESSGRRATYSITPEEGCELAYALLAVSKDIEDNCLYERDSLLINE